MESNPLLAALQSNYGDGTEPPPDPTTVKGLLVFCKRWLDGETETAELNNPCMEMAVRLKGGAKDQEADLRKNPDLVDSARAPMERMAEAFWTISEILDRLPELAQDNDVEAYQEAIEIFEDERQIVLDCNAELENTLSGKVRLCPRCGDATEEELCSKCDLVKLYPDPRQSEYDRSKSAVLAPIYGTVNKAYDKVMAGEASLHTVYPPVDQLEAYLAELQQGYQKALELELPEGEEEKAEGFQEARDLAVRLLRGIERSFQGIDRIRNATESFQMSDLSRGWETIFNAAVDIQKTTERYALSNGLIERPFHEQDKVQLD